MDLSVTTPIVLIGGLENAGIDRKKAPSGRNFSF